MAPGATPAASVARPSPKRSRLSERFAAAKAADAVELDQARIRLFINPACALYLLVASTWDGVVDAAERQTLLAMLVLLLLSLAHVAWVLWRPGINHFRRRVAVLLDLGAATAVMFLGGKLSVPLFVVYPWVVIGNGFRYGRGYLHYAQAVAFAGFLAVVALSAYWRDQLVFAAALLLILLAIPFYVSALLARLHAARAEAEAANLAKTKFLAAASHDLRQPMQALSMYASVLQERITSPDAARVVNGVRLSVTTLERLFDGILDISKIEAGKMAPSVIAFQLMPLIGRVAESERVFAAQKGLELRVASTSASVSSDPLLLERILQNLVSNAIRYTERGKVLIGCRRLAGGRLRIEVADTGVGIPSKEQERIFDDYYQLGGASAQGLGLGLPIVKSLGALLGHKVRVRSVPGRGSIFSIELGCATSVAAAEEVGTPPRAAFAGASVVLVDDDVEIRESMRLLIENWGCHLIAGATLADVERELGARGVRPDALIVDYQLADASTGLQVIERLRERFGARLPALVVTGTPNAAVLQHAFGDIPFAMKPIPAGKLRAFLARLARAEA